MIRLIKLTSPFKWWMLLAALLGFLTVGSSIGLLMTSAYIISKAALQPSISELQVGIVGVRFFGIARGIFRYMERLISHDITFKLLAKIRVWFYEAVEPLAPAGLIHTKRSDLMHKIVNDVEHLDHIFIRIISPPLVAIATSILMWILLGIYYPLFSVLLFVFHLLAGLGIPLFTWQISKSIGPQLIKIKTQLNSLVIDGIQGMSDLIIFGQDKQHFKSINELNRRYIKTQRKYQILLSLHESMIGLIMNCAVVFMLTIAIPQVTSSTLDGVYLAVITLGIIASFEAILPLPAIFMHVDSTAAAAKQVFDISDKKPEITTSGQSISEIKTYDIQFQNVSFTYSLNEESVLKNVSLNIPHGAKVAIVGQSGAGKSSLTNLILRFWDYQKGNIYLGKNDLRNLSPEAIRDKISLVSQNTHIFSDTLKKNLLLANIDATTKELNNILNMVQLSEMVAKLENGLDNWIGEHGFTLSSGERQRIAIARALLKNTPILVLDEFTANLDSVTEQQILTSLFKIADQKSIIWVTHRLTNLEKMDIIYVLHKGELIEQGTVSDLLSGDSYFKKMYFTQKQDEIIKKNINCN